MSIFDWLLSPDGLTPHGFCLTWAPGLLWMHAGSDALIALAYFSIPLALVSFVSQRKDMQYHWVAYLFGAFILACGLTHVMAIYTLWVPAYGVEGLIKLVTAVLSIATAGLLWPLIPRLVALPSPDQLRELNAKLSETVVEQARTANLLRESETKMRGVALDLEQSVAERTADLQAANAKLTKALAERTAAETALRESELRQRLAIGAARLGVSEIDYEHNRGRIDARTAEMTDAPIPPDTWLSLDGPETVAWTQQIHPDDLDRRNAAFEAMRSGETDTTQIEYRLRRADGAWNTLTHWRAVTARHPATNAPLRAVSVYLDTTDRARIEADLRTALGQRDLLLREVYHRVKNNLQIVDGLLMLQSRAVKDPTAVEALTGLRSRIYALGLVHSQLMASKNLETFDIAPFLTELSQNIVAGAARSNVRLEVDASPLEVDLDFALPLGLLVTELVTNSLKHAFGAGPGLIRVALSRDGQGSVTLIVSDDGYGDAAAAASQGEGAVVERAGTGAAIIAGLVGQLSGRLTLDTDGGRTTTITVPEPEPA